MDQVRSQDIGEGINRAPPQEYYYHGGLDRPAAATGLSEADGVLVLMELLEEDEEEKYSTTSPPHVGNVLPEDDDADRLSRVIRSLEAEIMRGGDNGECLTRPPGEINGAYVQLDDMLLDFDDGFGGAQAFGYCWPEVPSGGLYVYSEGGEGSVVGYEQVAREQQYYCANQCSVEQVYTSSLWE